MRSSMLLVAGACLVFLGTSGAPKAAPLNWSGSASMFVAELPWIVLTGGGVATVNASAGGVPGHLSTLRLAESRGNVGGTQTAIVTDPGVAPGGILALQLEAGLGTGTPAPISGGAASTTVLTSAALPLRGVAKICLLSSQCTSFISLLLTQPTTLNGVPGEGIKGVGVGGLLTAGGFGGVRISWQAAPWTIKRPTAIDQIETSGGGTTFITYTAPGFAHGLFSTTTSTAQPGGVLQLVTPIQISTNLTQGTRQKMASFVILMVHFIPEPGMLLMLGAGVLGLAVLGHRRMRE